MPAPSGDRATLSRDLADFLIELSIALHKHAMYPEGHPSLAPAAAGVTRRAGLLLLDRATLSLGVARQQLVIEGVATDPKHPVLAELAARLHRHHLGAVTFRRGVEAGEMASVLKTLAVDAVALRRRTSRLIGALKPETLQRLVEMGGDFVQRRQFVYDATDGMAVDAVLDIVQAAADSSHQTISHSLVRMLSKLAAHAEAGAAKVRSQADAALRDQVRRLLEGWTLADPNPGAYGAALQRMARAAPEGGAPADGAHSTEPDRIVAMALEVDAVNAHVLAAADRVVQAGRLGHLLDALADVPEAQGAAPEVWARLATADVVRQLAMQEPVDFKTLERLVPRAGPRAAPPLRT